MIKKKLERILLTIFIGLLSHSSLQAGLGRKVEKFDLDWRFHLGDVQGAAAFNFDDKGWRLLNVPHDWSIEQPFVNDKKLSANGFLPGGIGWYRKHFTVSQKNQGKKIYLHFEGVYHQSDVYINGHHLGFHPYGYTPFEYDLTDYLKFGEDNVIAVRVNHAELPSSRWYSGSGIYRNVWLKVLDPVHIDLWGSFVSTPEVSAQKAVVRIETSIKNTRLTTGTYTIVTEIVDRQGKRVAINTQALRLQPGIVSQFKQQVEIKDPVLWSDINPYLYQVRTTVKKDGKVIDESLAKLGIRVVEWSPDKGFLLNGKVVKLKGMNLHTDAGAVGTAVPPNVWKRRLKTLKELGCNAIRASHNPPDRAFLELCDSMGFLVIDEALDKWRRYGYYQKYFEEWWQKDIGSMVLRDRNHSSVILWSVGNEVIEQNLPSGTDTVKLLVDYVHKLDPTRKVMVGLNPSRGFNENGFAQALDVVGYNYQEPWYEQDKKDFPSRIFIGTETYCYFRGYEGNKMNFETRRNPWYDVAENDYVAGSFLWPGIDYIGEVGGWPLKIRSSGIIDIAGFPKAIAGFFKAVWLERPVVALAVLDDHADLKVDPAKLNWSYPKMVSHWNFPYYKKHLVRVHTFTNCESVELQVNQRSFGERNTAEFANNTIEWWVPYAEGHLIAIGKNNGAEVTRDTLTTAQAPAKIQLQTSEEKIVADRQDAAVVELKLLDEKGTLVSDADLPVTFSIEGPGKLIGIDNGNQDSDESFKTHTRHTRFGKLIAIVQSTGQPGVIRVIAQPKGLPQSELIIHSAIK
ncbi:sugar-binding domain-containing protein [Niabella aquatica]